MSGSNSWKSLRAVVAETLSWKSARSGDHRLAQEARHATHAKRDACQEINWHEAAIISETIYNGHVKRWTFLTQSFCITCFVIKNPISACTNINIRFKPLALT